MKAKVAKLAQFIDNSLESMKVIRSYARDVAAGEPATKVAKRMLKYRESEFLHGAYFNGIYPGVGSMSKGYTMADALEAAILLLSKYASKMEAEQLISQHLEGKSDNVAPRRMKGGGLSVKADKMSTKDLMKLTQAQRKAARMGMGVPRTLAAARILGLLDD